MAERNSTPPVFNVVCRPGSIVPLIAVILSLTAGLFLAGCAGQDVTWSTVQSKSPERVYQVTEQDALELAQWAMAQVLPDQEMHRLKKPRLGLFVHEMEQTGHYKYARFRDATFTYTVDLIRLQGSLPQGGGAIGYSYAISGSGNLKAGPEKLAQLEKRLAEAFEQSGRGMAVSSDQPSGQSPPTISSQEAPASSSNAPALVAPSAPKSSSTGRPEKQPAIKTAPPAETPMATVQEQPAEEGNVFDKLKKLKELLDQGIITQDEFQTKKKELLDRI